jgi:hypothetical protein
MPRGSKTAYSAKQKRMEEHVEDSEMNEGRSKKAAERIGWATVNKITGGSGKNKKKNNSRGHRKHKAT